MHALHQLNEANAPEVDALLDIQWDAPKARGLSTEEMAARLADGLREREWKSARVQAFRRLVIEVPHPSPLVPPHPPPWGQREGGAVGRNAWAGRHIAQHKR